MTTNNAIPKIIHYCWFGSKEKPELIKKCIASWKQILPDYKIIEWNENNTQFIKHPYFLSALNNKKWAFAADYARFLVLQKYGGIYMDTDEEVFSTLNAFLKYDLFLGFERYKGNIHPMGGVIGAQPNNKTIQKILKTYDDTPFLTEKDCFDLTPITFRLKKFFIENYNLPLDHDGMTIFEFDTNSAIFPANYFCEHSGIETIAMHHYAFSWKENTLQKKYCIFSDPVSENHIFSIYNIPTKEMPEQINAKVLFKCKILGRTILLVREPIKK